MSVLGSNRKWTSGEAVRPYLDLRVGDAVPVEGSSAAIFDRGERAWYALLCRPQQERHAESWLAARGVYAFHRLCCTNRLNTEVPLSPDGAIPQLP